MIGFLFLVRAPLRSSSSSVPLMLSCLRIPILRDQSTSSQEAICLLLTRIPFLRSFSLSAGDAVGTGEPPDDLARPRPLSATVSFLTDCLGLSSDVTVDGVKRLRVSPTVMASHDPKGVLEFFLSRGFTEVQIAKIIASEPSFLTYNVKKTLKPKMDFLSGTLGLSDSEIAKLVSCGSGILKASLERQIRPTVAFLSSNVGSSKDVITVVKRAPWILCSNVETRISPKFEVLRSIGVPDSGISKMATSSARSFTQSTKRFNEVIESLKELGCSPTVHTYVLAFHAVSSLGMVNLKRKMSLYRSYGVTEAEVLSYFHRAPNIFTLSDQKIRTNMEFFLTNFNWNPQIVLSRPAILTLSLEQRIIPRAMVRSVLLSKGFLKSNKVNSAIFFVGEDDFLQNYVLKFQKVCPDLLNTYQKAKEMASESHSRSVT